MYLSLSYSLSGRDELSAIDKMAADVERQITKRSKFSRRRTHVDDADISYINERNKKFNEKCERFYGNYTEEIRQNLERGTALWAGENMDTVTAGVGDALGMQTCETFVNSLRIYLLFLQNVYF